jgi:hypothetical protein
VTAFREVKAQQAAAAAELGRSMTKESALCFFEQCTALTRQLHYDPLAEPRAELLTGSCIWTDERCRDWCGECMDKVKELFHLRYQITVCDSVPPETLAFFLGLEKRFPNWPLFRPERRSPEIAEKVRRMVRHNLKRACIEIERLDREYRKREAEQTR